MYGEKGSRAGRTVSDCVHCHWVLARARPLLSALRGGAVRSPGGRAAICLGRPCCPPGRSRCWWSWPSPDLHLTLDPGAARKPLGWQQGDVHLLGAVLFCQRFLNTSSFMLSRSGTFQGLPEKPTSTSILWEWKQHPPLTKSPLMPPSRGCSALRCVPSASLSHHQPGSPHCGCI